MIKRFFTSYTHVFKNGIYNIVSYNCNIFTHYWTERKHVEILPLVL